MPARGPSSFAPTLVRAPAQGRSPRLHIESLRVRVPGQGRTEGQEFASELRAALTEQAPSLFTRLRSGMNRIEGLQLSVRAASEAEAPGAASSAILRAISRAVDSTRTR